MFGVSGGPHPAVYMVIAVIAYSVTPVLYKIGNAGDSPFMFTGIWQSSIGIGSGAVILFFGRGVLFNAAVFESIKSHCKTWLMLGSVAGYCGFALFAWSLAFVDVSIAAILYNAWPLIIILLMSRLFKDTGRYRRITLGTLIFVFVALLGVALVILSNRDAPNPLLVIGDEFAGASTWIGVILVLLASFGTAARAFPVKMSVTLAKEHLPPEHQKTGEIIFVIVMSCIGLAIAGGVLFAIGMITSESISLHQMFYACMGGLVAGSTGTVAFRVANVKTDELGVNAIAFATPLVTLLWLWMLSIIDVPHLDYLIIGALGIVASNLLINVDASKRLAYKALVASLWLFGAITYFTEGYTTEVPLELPVTIFILVLAFRVERLARRTSQEEGWLFDAFRRLALMEQEKNTSSKASGALREALKSLLAIDDHRTAAQLKNEYKKIVKLLRNARDAGFDEEKVTEILRLVDKMSHSRQQGARLGEIVAIALTGALIVFGLLVFNGNGGIYGEIISFVLSSVVAFLFFNIIDLHEDRKDKTLIIEDGEYIVNFGEVKNREIQQYFSTGTSCVIVIVFVVLFFIKG